MKISTSILLLLISIPLWSNEPIATLPFKIHRGHIYIKGQINGKDANIIFDTGAPINVVNEGFLSNLPNKWGYDLFNGVNGIVDLRKIKKNTIDLGNNILLKKQDVYIADINHLQDFDLPVDAIIGGEVLRKFVVELDFDYSNLKLYKRNGFKKPDGFLQSEIVFNGTKFSNPFINGTIRIGEIDVTGVFTIDTGASMPLSLNGPIVKENNMLDKIGPYYKDLSRGLGAENDTIEYNGRISRFELLAYEFDEVPSSFSITDNRSSQRVSNDGLIGLEILKRFNIIFDYKEGKLYTSKNKFYSEPFETNNHGLILVKKDRHFEILFVVRNSAADLSKILKGDRILKVDGKENMTHDEFSKYANQEGKEIKLTIMRGEETFEVIIKPFAMI